MPKPSEYIKERESEVNDWIAQTITTQIMNSIPEAEKIPLEGSHWLKIPALTCVFADLVGSTELQVTNQPTIAAKTYQIFVGSLVKTLNDFQADYIDVRGDGAFGLFSGKNSEVAALCAAVTFQTFTRKVLRDKVNGFKIRAHIGIDRKGVLVKRVGLRGERQNEVWAGKPVNMAAKLSSLAEPDQILVSERVYTSLDTDDFRKWAIMSCGCTDGRPGGSPANLWIKQDVSDKSYFDFKSAYLLRSFWCDIHGDEFCSSLLNKSQRIPEKTFQFVK